MKHLLFCSALCATFVACSWFHGETISPTFKYANREMLDSLEVYKSYFYPHEIGDSIVFLREDSTTDIYYVDKTHTGPWISYDKNVDTMIMSAGIHIYLQHDEEYIRSGITIERSGLISKRIFVYNNMETWNGVVPDFPIEKDDVVATGFLNDSKSVFRRNTGIVHVQDDKRHTWTTILP